MLRVEVVSQLSPKDRLIEEWSSLADACASATVFQTPEWLVTWWMTIGRFDRGSRLQILAMRDDDRLVGLVPLIFSRWYKMPIRRLSFMGAGVTDYNDAVAEPGREDEVATAFYAWIAKEADGSVLDLRELREGGLLRERRPTKAAGLFHLDVGLEECPYLSIPTDVPIEERWAKLLSGYSKKMRGNVGYYERSLQRAFQVRSEMVKTPDELPDALDALFELHRRRWNRRWLPGVFAGKRVQEFHRAVTPKLLAKGALRMHVLALDDEVQAVLYGFAFHDRTCYYQGGFEPELAKYSLGSVLIASAIKQATLEGFETFDFLRGNEDYKQRWTSGAHRVNIRRLVARSEAQLGLARQIHGVESGVERQIKSMFAGGIVRRPASGAAAGATQE
jgi:CelD/BcsL family acetyltransferase involved in cellulose biosynthesis